MNKDIRLLEDNLITILNNSPVEIEVKRLILTNLLNLVKKQADSVILQELNEEQKDAEST